MCLIFVVRGIRRKFFNAEFFPNYGMLQYCVVTISGMILDCDITFNDIILYKNTYHDL